MIVAVVVIAGAAIALLTRSTTHPIQAALVPAKAHPRLLFTSADIPALQAKVRDGAGYDDAEFTANQSRALSLLGQSGSGLIGSYWGIYNVQALGMAYRLALDSDPNKLNYRSKCQEALSYLATTIVPNVPEAGNAHNSSLRLLALATGFDLCFDDLADGDPIPAGRQTIIDEILTYLQPDPNYQTAGAWFDWWTRATPPYTSNKGFILGSAMGLGSIVLRGETANTAVLDQALAWGHAMVINNLHAHIDTDGRDSEGELYGPFATRYLILYVEGRQRYDGLDLSTRPELRHYGDWLVYGILPTSSGFSIQTNNGNYTEHPVAWNDTYQSWAQTKYSSQIARYAYDHTSGLYNYTYQHDRMAAMLWGQGAATQLPSATLPNSKLFAGTGFYVYRTGWPALGSNASDDTIFTLYAGLFKGGHAQEDQGEFSLFSQGNWFLRDSGVADFPGTGAKESEAHNIVFIDNAGEHNAGSSVGTDGHITASNLNGFADYLQADLKDAYSTYSPLNAPNYPWPGSDWSWGYQGANPVQQANRHVLTVKAGNETPEYFLLYDDIQKDANTHTFDWTFHTETSFGLSTSSNPVVITGFPSSRKLKLYFANPSFSTTTFSSATYAMNSNDPDLRRIKATVSGVTNPKFLVALQPVNEGTTAEPIMSTPTGVTGAIASRFSWPTVTDTVYVKTGGSVQDGTLASDAQMLLARRNGSGALAKFQLGNGTSLSDQGNAIVAVTGGTASVASDGVTVSVSDPTLAYVIYGPDVTMVQSNYQSVAHAKSGDYVYVNTAVPLTMSDSSVQAAGITASSATISWTTNSAADSQVEYGPTVAYGTASPTDATAVTNHSMTLTGLDPSTTYHYRVHSAAGGVDVYSSDKQFMTQAAPAVDSTAPSPVSDLRAR